MDKFDGASLKKMEEEKKEGTDQGSVAKTEPVQTGPYVRQTSDDDGGCTIGDTGKIIFYAGFFAIVTYGVVCLLKKKE